MPPRIYASVCQASSWTTMFHCQPRLPSPASASCHVDPKSQLRPPKMSSLDLSVQVAPWHCSVGELTLPTFDWLPPAQVPNNANTQAPAQPITAQRITNMHQPPAGNWPSHRIDNPPSHPLPPCTSCAGLLGDPKMGGP